MPVLDRQLQKRVQVASKRLGLNESEVINRAVSTYLGSVEELVNLQHELHQWDTLAAKSLRSHKF